MPACQRPTCAAIQKSQTSEYQPEGSQSTLATPPVFRLWLVSCDYDVLQLEISKFQVKGEVTISLQRSLLAAGSLTNTTEG